MANMPLNGAIDLISARRISAGQPLQQQNFTQQDDTIKAIRRQSSFIQTPFEVGLTAIKLRDYEERTYFLLQNTDTVNSLYIGFGILPTSLTGLIIPPGGYYEPYQVPTNEIYVLGSGANTSGMLMFSVGNA